jgi:hypothetical protein
MKVCLSLDMMMVADVQLSHGYRRGTSKSSESLLGHT